MVKSFLFSLFVLSFIFSATSEAATPVDVAKVQQKKSIAKTVVTKKSVAPRKKIVRENAKIKKSTLAKVKVKKVKGVAKTTVKKSLNKNRKVVRVDFSKPQNKKSKIRQELKKVAKVKSNKKNYKAIPCHNGYIVGQQAFCSDETKNLALVHKKSKNARSLASSKDLSIKKKK